MAPFSFSSQARELAERCFDDSLPAIDRLLYAASLQSYLGDAMQALAAVARSEEGHSWSEVGQVLTISKQAAQQKLSASPLPLDEKGRYRGNPAATYVESLRRLAADLQGKEGRERDLRLLEAGIAHFGGEGMSDEQYRQSLVDARDALVQEGGREDEVAMLEKTLKKRRLRAPRPPRS